MEQEEAVHMGAMPAMFLSGTERRAAARFPIEQEVRFKITGRGALLTGGGRTVNMSSTGVLFSTDCLLKVGDRIELAVNWPAQLDNRCALKLVTSGRVVRSENGRVAITIERYEFRTQGAHGLTA